MKLLTIIIPVYNVAPYLRACLDSVLAAVGRVEEGSWSKEREVGARMNKLHSPTPTFNSNSLVEIICVDDGSTDGSGEVLDEYAARDNRFKVIHQENGGYGRAVNCGFDYAKGEWIAIVESDDQVEEWMFVRLLSTGLDSSVDVVKCGFAYVNNGVETQEIIWPEEVKNRVFVIQEVPELLRWHPSIWSCIYRRSFLCENNIRMLETPGASWADNPFQVQTLCLARGIACVEGAGYKYRVFCGKLKNWRLPFERSREIHEWMEDRGIDNLGLRMALSRRECVYLRIAAEVVPWRSLFAVISAVHELVGRWPSIVDARNFGLSGRELWKYAVWRYFPCVRMMAVINRYVRGVMRVLRIL